MRLSLTFGIHIHDEWLRDHVASRCPMALELGETAGQLLVSKEPAMRALALVLECSVAEPEAMTAVPGLLVFRETPGQPDGEPVPVLSCPELDLLALRAEEIAGALSLLYNEPVSCGPLMGVPETTNELVAESDEDAQRIAALGDVLVDPVIRGTFGASALGSFELDGGLLSDVAARDGVRVYWEAQHAGGAGAAFRDLWRTLELKFGEQDDALIKKLAASAEARELGFDDDELKDYLVLRGRASHGASRTGHREAAHVHHLVLERIGRLRALVERVLIGDRIPFPEGRRAENFNRTLNETAVRRNARSG